MAVEPNYSTLFLHRHTAVRWTDDAMLPAAQLSMRENAHRMLDSRGRPAAAPSYASMHRRVFLLSSWAGGRRTPS